jgi:hypothetical protein
VVGAGSERGRCLRHRFSPILGLFRVDTWSFNRHPWEKDSSERVQLFTERGNVWGMGARCRLPDFMGMEVWKVIPRAPIYNNRWKYERCGLNEHNNR